MILSAAWLLDMLCIVVWVQGDMPAIKNYKRNLQKQSIFKMYIIQKDKFQKLWSLI